MTLTSAASAVATRTNSSSPWSATAAGGTLLIKDIRSTGSFPQNLKEMPSLAMLYGFSVTSCLSSAMSEPGLGTVGFNPPTAERMCTDAGFESFVMHDFKDPSNLYYEMLSPVPAGGSGVRAAPTSSLDHTVDLSGNPGPSTCACHAHTQLFLLPQKL